MKNVGRHLVKMTQGPNHRDPNSRQRQKFLVSAESIGETILHVCIRFVRVMENLESHGISIFEIPGLENLESQFWS